MTTINNGLPSALMAQLQANIGDKSIRRGASAGSQALGDQGKARQGSVNTSFDRQIKASQIDTTQKSLTQKRDDQRTGLEKAGDDKSRLGKTSSADDINKASQQITAFNAQNREAPVGRLSDLRAGRASEPMGQIFDLRV